MPHNQIKIVSNAKKQSLKFYFKNEEGKWSSVSNDSVLSRKEYISATVQDRATDIVRIIDSVYNPGNRGVDIYFEGGEADFRFLKDAVNSQFSKSNIICVMQKTLIAVAGKIGAGKTSLIEGFWKYKNIPFKRCEKDGILVFADDEKTSVWYEIPGIDFGVEHMANARNALEKLAKSNITTFVYCLGTKKIEALEEELISFARDNYPDIKILVVLTQFVDEEQDKYVEQLSADLEGVKVIPVLAMDKKTRHGVVSAYGLDDIERYIF